jgi:HK97 family phage portal protein
VSLFGEVFDFRTSLENPRTSLANPAAWLFDAFGIEQSDAGVPVNATTAMKCSAVYACINILAQGVAQVPWDVMRKTGDLRVTADDRYEHWLLHNEPNELMSSYDFRVWYMATCLSRGNVYAEIIRDGAAKSREIRPLPSEAVRILKHPTRYAAVYEVTREDGTQQRLDGSDVLHNHCLSLNGWSGLSPVTQMAQSIGLGLAAEKTGANLFGKGSMLSGLLTSEGPVTKAQEQDIVEAWNKMYSGVRNSGGTAFLKGGLKWQQISINPNDAQFLETREFQVGDIARAFRVPPQMLGLKDANPTYASVEQFFKAFVTLSLSPWVTAIEQEFNRKLFPGKTDIYNKLNMNGLLRGDAATRAAFYQTMVNVGAFCPNDILALEDMNPIEGGDKHLAPSNMTTLEKIGEEPPAPAPVKADPKAARDVYVRWLGDVASRVAKWEKRDNGKVADALYPVLSSMCEGKDVRSFCEAIAPDVALPNFPVYAIDRCMSEVIE